MGRDLITCHITLLVWVNQTNLVFTTIKNSLIMQYSFFKIIFLFMEVTNTKYLFNGENPLPKLILPQLLQISLILPKLTVFSNKKSPDPFCESYMAPLSSLNDSYKVLSVTSSYVISCSWGLPSKSKIFLVQEALAFLLSFLLSFPSKTSS